MNNYWERIKQTLKGFWQPGDDLACIKVFPLSNSTCQLCGKHPILWNHVLQNNRSFKTLTVGSDCVHNFKVAVEQLHQDVMIFYPSRYHRPARIINENHPGTVILSDTNTLPQDVAADRALADAIRHGLLTFGSDRILDAEDFDEFEEFYYETPSTDKDEEEFKSDDLAPEGMGGDEIDYDSFDYDERE